MDGVELAKAAEVSPAIPDGHKIGFDFDSMEEGWDHVSASGADYIDLVA